MPDQALERFIVFLEERAARVRALEIDSTQALEGPEGSGGFAKHMRAKAELLAALSQDVKPLLAGIPDAQASLLARKIKIFSAGASNSLRLNSTFYMSALLYTNEHKPGEPNNLEVFISELRRAG